MKNLLCCLFPAESRRPYLKELEVYAADRPPANYGQELEVEGISGVADATYTTG